MFEKYSAERDKKTRGFVRTERPVYGLGDSVFIKGYVRETVYGTITLPPKELSYTLSVQSPSQAYRDYPITLNEYGSFDKKIALRKSAAGEYRVSLRSKSEQYGTAEIASTDFLAEAYRSAKFDIKLSGPERIRNDSAVEIRAIASYRDGRPAAGRRFDFNIIPTRYDYRPRGFAGYIFSSDLRYKPASETGRRPGIYGTAFAKTDDSGSYRITLDPQEILSESDPRKHIGDPIKYIVKAVVTDTDSQRVSSYHTAVAFPPFVLGLRANRHITSGSTISARVAAVGMNDSLVAGQKVTAALKRVLWTSRLVDSDFSSGTPQYVAEEVIELVRERNITTIAKNPSLAEFKNMEPGVYILEVSSLDKIGRSQSVKVDLFLAGSKSQTQKKGERGEFEIVPDRNTYEPGQQAKILIKSPYARALALTVAELPGGDIRYKWVNVSGGRGSFTFDIKQDMTPQIPISFLLMPPREPARRGAPDSAASKPEAIGHTEWITVNPVANTLDVRLTHAPMITLGSTLDVTVSIRDNQGKPRAGEAALWLVDNTVMSLRKEKDLDPLEAFFENVPSRVTISTSGNLAPAIRHDIENHSGEADNNGNELDGFGEISLPKNPNTVPYWNPSIIIDKSGNAAVSIPVSSNLTSYSIRAAAVSGPDRFGAAKSRVSVQDR
jgi:uncharacterized protein YfaS (alpha-2-macroglobulin family)